MIYSGQRNTEEPQPGWDARVKVELWEDEMAKQLRTKRRGIKSQPVKITRGDGSAETKKQWEYEKDAGRKRKRGR